MKAATKKTVKKKTIKRTKKATEKELALRSLKERKANVPEQRDNASFPAGSPMLFYCQFCGHRSDTLPECYINPPKRLCDECQAMKDSGWLEEDE